MCYVRTKGGGGCGGKGVNEVDQAVVCANLVVVPSTVLVVLVSTDDVSGESCN